MTKIEQRQIAISATRSQACSQQIDPHTIDGKDALAVLDDIARSEPSLIASQWYSKASDSQIKTFIQEWNRWRRES